MGVLPRCAHESGMFCWSLCEPNVEYRSLIRCNPMTNAFFLPSFHSPRGALRIHIHLSPLRLSILGKWLSPC